MHLEVKMPQNRYKLRIEDKQARKKVPLLFLEVVMHRLTKIVLTSLDVLIKPRSKV